MDESQNAGVAIVGVNNPHLEEDEIAEYRVCDEIPDHPFIQVKKCKEHFKKEKVQYVF